MQGLGRSPLFCYLSTAVGVFCLATPAGLACPYSIRDTAYLDAERPVDYTLYFVVDETTADVDSLAEDVASAREAWLLDSNVAAKVVDANDQDAHRLRETLSGRLEDHGPLPMAVLVSPQNKALVLGTIDAQSSSLDGVMTRMVETVESPARLEALGHLIESWCIVLLIEGTDADENERAAEIIAAASKRITGTVTEMDRVVETGPHLIRIAHDDPEERVLLWSLGLWDPKESEDGQEGVRVAMLVGKAELRGPVLEGDDLTEKNLYDALEMLGRNCTCTTDEMWTAGPRAPLAWGAEMQQAVEVNLGFDPDSPEALELLNSAIAGGAIAGGAGPLGETNRGIGYRETIFETRRGPAAPMTEDADEDTAANEESDDEPQVALAKAGESPAEQATSPEQTAAETRNPPSTESPRSSGLLMWPLLLVFGAVALLLAVITALVLKRT
jgi:hypothetical protein